MCSLADSPLSLLPPCFVFLSSYPSIFLALLKVHLLACSLIINLLMLIFFFTCYTFFLSSILTLSSPRSLSLLLFLSNSSYVMTLHECWTINWCSPIDYIDTLYIEMYVQFHTYWYKKHTHAKRQSFISVTYSHIRISFLSLKATLLSYFIQSYKCVFLNIIFCSLAH